MTNQNFIKNCVQGRYSTGKSCNNLYFDGKHVYSYGGHYPLLVSVGDFWIVNIRGYSRTTSRHISYARQWAHYEMDINMQTGAGELLELAKGQLRATRDHLASLSDRAWKQKENTSKKIGQLMRVVGMLEKAAKPGQSELAEVVF